MGGKPRARPQASAWESTNRNNTASAEMVIDIWCLTHTDSLLMSGDELHPGDEEAGVLYVRGDVVTPRIPESSTTQRATSTRWLAGNC